MVERSLSERVENLSAEVKVMAKTLGRLELIVDGGPGDKGLKQTLTDFMSLWAGREEDKKIFDAKQKELLREISEKQEKEAKEKREALEAAAKEKQLALEAQEQREQEATKKFRFWLTIAIALGMLIIAALDYERQTKQSVVPKHSEAYDASMAVQ
jgi:hypothetical protein